MTGDRFRIYYSTFEDGNSQLSSTHNDWIEAKEERNKLLFGNPQTIKSAWIMRDNPSLRLRNDKRGHTLRRARPGQ